MCGITFDWEKNDAARKFKHHQDRSPLTWGVIELTSKCNFDCKWCFANAQPHGEHMSRENVYRLIEYFANGGLKQITFTGGEPTIYPWLSHVIRKAKDHDMVVHMNTNGYLFTEELASELGKAGLSQMETNIDSLNPREHDGVRGMEGSFQRSVQAIKNGLGAGLTCVMQTVMTKRNEHEIYDILRFGLDLGAQRSRVWDLVPSEGRASDSMDGDMAPTHYIESAKELTEFAIANGVINIESLEPLFPLDFAPGVSITGGFCVFGAGLVINVSPSGDVFFCASDRKSVYNIFEEMSTGDVQEVHDKFLKRLPQVMVPDECGGCSHVNICKGGCYTRRRYNNFQGDYWCNDSQVFHQGGREAALV